MVFDSSYEYNTVNYNFTNKIYFFYRPHFSNCIMLLIFRVLNEIFLYLLFRNYYLIHFKEVFDSGTFCSHCNSFFYSLKVDGIIMILFYCNFCWCHNCFYDEADSDDIYHLNTYSIFILNYIFIVTLNNLFILVVLNNNVALFFSFNHFFSIIFFSESFSYLKILFKFPFDLTFYVYFFASIFIQFLGLTFFIYLYIKV